MNTQVTQEIAAVRAYLVRLERGLRPLPKEDRTAILAEIQSHITESCINGATAVDDVLHNLGDADELAQSYVEQYQLADALAHPARIALLLLLLERATRSLAALITGFGATVLYVCGVSFAAVAILKPIMPNNVGLWWGPGAHALGVISGLPADATERLGYWIVPLGVVAAILCYIGGSALMRIGGRRLLRHAAAKSNR